MNIEMKVFQINEYDWVASPLSKMETIEWYEDFSGEKVDEAEVLECNLTEEKGYTPVDDKFVVEFLEKLYENEKLRNVSITAEGVNKKGAAELVRFKRISNEWCIYVEFEKILEKEGYYDEPYIMMSTQY